MLTNLHLLDVKNKTAIEDLGRDGTLTAKNQDLVVGHLISKTHIARNPIRLVAEWSGDLLPDVLGDVVALDRVHNLALVDSTAKSKDEVVFEAGQGHAASRNPEAVDLRPLVLPNVVNFTRAKDLAVHEAADNVDEAFKTANRVVSVRVNHASLLVEQGEDLVVSVALLEVLVSSLVAPADKVDTAILGGDASRVQRHVQLHLDSPLLERLRVDLVDVSELLVPLEGVHSGGDARLEGVLDVVVNSQVGFDEVLEVLHDLVGVLV